MPSKPWKGALIQDPDTGRFYWAILDVQGKWRAKAPQTFAAKQGAKQNLILFARQIGIEKSMEILPDVAQVGYTLPGVRYNA